MEEKLIEAVRKHQMLYDTSHEDYMRTKLKAEKWEKVAVESEMRSGAEAKALWEKLRHSLRDALRRQQKCFKSGAPAATIKPWKFQKHMGFLQPFMANKECEGNLHEDRDSVDENLTQSCEDDARPTDVHEEQLQYDNIQPESETIEGAQLQDQDLHESSPSSTSAPSSAKRMKKYDVTSLLKRNMGNREERARVRANERAQLLEHLKPTEDPLFHFFISMYETTTKMPPSFQLDVRKRVFTVVTDVEAILLNMQQNYYSQSAMSTPVYSSYSDSSSSHMTTRNEESLPPATDSSEINLVNFINHFSE